MNPVLVFDIETVPDVAGLRKLHGVPQELSDADVAAMAFQLRRQTAGHDFLPLHLQRVVAISCALRERDAFRVWSLGGGGEPEAEIIQRFFDGIEKYTPQLVSWNGGGFDLPVLHYRGLMHGVRAPRYWDTGDDDRDFRYNNYISRYHMRHCDLMDLLALYQGRAVAPLDEIAQLLGLPGKLGMGGSQRLGRVSGGAARRHPQLLRDRRRQHVSRVPALPGDARRSDAGRIHGRMRARALDARPFSGASLGRIPCALAR